jgi:protein-tyrosine-phosphatase
MKVLFVCTGNVNRSAAAQVVAISAGFHAVSAGTSPNAAARRPMAKQMRLTLASLGADEDLINQHRSQHVDEVDDLFDYVVGFQESHRKWAHQTHPATPYYTMVDVVPEPKWGIKVPDPGFDRSLVAPVGAYIAHATPLLFEMLP